MTKPTRRPLSPKALVLIASLVLCHAQAASLHVTRIKSGWWVQDTQGHRLKLQMDFPNTSLEIPEGIYIAGVRINARGDNLDWVAFVPRDLSEPTYWPFTTRGPLKQFFRLQGKTYVFDYDGAVYLAEARGWKPAPWQFGPKAVAYAIDDERDAIICHPAPDTKAESGTRTGGCRSLVKGWQIPLYWVETEPKICGQQLVALAWEKGKPNIFRLSLRDGTMMPPTKPFKRRPPFNDLDLCKLTS